MVNVIFIIVCFCNKEIYNIKSKFCSEDCKISYELRNRTQKGIYKYFCMFLFPLNMFEDEFDFNLIIKYGWYSPKNKGNNLNGISRDHKYSCSEGFKNLIDPYIISHPANCELLQHHENQIKKTKCSITLNELINNIINWNNKYGVYENKINYKVLESYNIKPLIYFKDFIK